MAGPAPVEMLSPIISKKQNWDHSSVSRTWGGLIGVSGAPSLIDGGVVYCTYFPYVQPGWYLV